MLRLCGLSPMGVAFLMLAGGAREQAGTGGSGPDLSLICSDSTPSAAQCLGGQHGQARASLGKSRGVQAATFRLPWEGPLESHPLPRGPRIQLQEEGPQTSAHFSGSPCEESRLPAKRGVILSTSSGAVSYIGGGCHQEMLP